MFGKKDKQDKPQQEKPQVITKDGRFYCYDCKTELPMRQDCPTCGKVIDWDKI